MTVWPKFESWQIIDTKVGIVAMQESIMQRL